MTSDLCQTGKYNATAIHLRGNWPCLFDGHAWVCIHHVRTPPQTIVLEQYSTIYKTNLHSSWFKSHPKVQVGEIPMLVEVKFHLNPFEASPASPAESQS